MQAGITHSVPNQNFDYARLCLGMRAYEARLVAERKGCLPVNLHLYQAIHLSTHPGQLTVRLSRHTCTGLVVVIHYALNFGG